MPRSPFPYLLLRHAQAELRQLGCIGGPHRRTARRIARAHARLALAAALVGSAGRAGAADPRFLDRSAPYGLVPAGLATSLALADLDGDGDLDALVGDLGGAVSFFENTGTRRRPSFAAPVSNAFGLPDVGTVSRPALGDLDADGDLDAFLCNNDGELGYFANTGSAAVPAFASGLGAPFGIANSGPYCAPILADIDGDGDLDVFVGTAATGSGVTRFFENIGSASEPNFAGPVTNPFGIPNVALVALPSFADVDGDGDLDAMVGDYYGTVVFSENTGTATAPGFVGNVGNPFGLAPVGGIASPAFADLDADGDLDLVIGSGAGWMQLFRNTGTRSAPAFEPPFGSGSFVAQESAPSFGDLDGDGDLDLVIGDAAGNLGVVENEGTRSTPDLGSFTTMVFGLDAPVGPFAHPALADIDGDGDLDLLTGSGIATMGRLDLFENTGSASAAAFAAPLAAPLGLLGDDDRPAPAFGDLDDDGDLDVTVGLLLGRFDTYPNTGSTSAPAFAVRTSNAFGLAAFANLPPLAPAFGDIDGDGDLDVVVGDRDGDLAVGLNSVTSGPALFTATTPTLFGLVSSVPGYSAPALADVDGDGDLDLTAGDYDGHLTLFENLAVELQCPSRPRPDCPFLSFGSLTLDERKPGKEKLAVKLGPGNAPPQEAFENPLLAAGTEYALCLYDDAGARVANLAIDRAGAQCGAQPCWSAIGGGPPGGKGYAFKDPTGASDGITSLTIKTGTPKQTKLQVAASNNAKKGRTSLRTGLVTALADATSVTVQLHATGGTCVESDASQIKRQPGLLKVK